MNIETQISLLKDLFGQRLDRLTEHEYMLKLTVASSNDKEWFDCHLSMVDRIHSLFELCVMNKNARRAMGYYCALESVLEDIDERVAQNTARFQNNRILL